MNDYLVDYEVLAEFLDKLLAEKYPNQPAEELKSIREDGIRKLDDKIGKEVFGTLTEPQLDELDHLLDNQSATPEDYQEFFKKSGIDVEFKVTLAMQDFKQEFLGGQNA
jgi:hypothetical protein